jgi:hypothetical protein
MATKNELQTATNANQREIETMLQAVGQSLSDWAFVEEGLFEIFARLMASPALGPPSCAFMAVDAMHAKIKMVDSMMCHSKAGRKVLPEWEKLKERCNALTTKRNALAHRRVTTLKIGRAKAQPALIAYKHDLRNALEEEYSVASHMKVDAVKGLSKKFRELGADLLKFASGIQHSA